MNIHLHYLINAIICWVIALMGIAGYFITVKRIQQKWTFWLVLFAGWGILAIPNSLLAFGIVLDQSYLLAIWLSSYILVFASLVLLFIRLVKILELKR